ncbi:ImmA/IrrE family metallo-endopeptidase [Antarcticimicrobium luteum]|jgi:Zn-dependent peptidase ImmA (M78 family)|uniref:ImmA/IrrE family metallo-endopeptidase n=1 Tax=Antarcticimicrobium luteum TaxID=2547397 RepID=A0A4R5VGK6_9RHOB|nr:ImmA/IrrE family metallo-endopeptidase [Antarcticimicrobium luteum]TDK52610.1 ImmA/IrrE family metallo-endopeptidase [Antarcticimicrobium luteum]
MALRRGFKTDAEWYAQDVRRELGIPETGKLCPWSLARHLEHIVVDLSSFQKEHPLDVARLRQCTGAKGFSAVTIHKGTARLVILNDGHEKPRQTADLAHELAHGLLHHVPLPLSDETGVRMFNARDEEEAHWLGPTLLVPGPAAHAIARQRVSIEMAAAQYGVSEELMRMRLNMSGAFKRAKAAGWR